MKKGRRAVLNIKTGLIHTPGKAAKAKKITRDKRIPTGIRQLDSLMGGGFSQGTVNLISGGPGSGKSIFSMQWLMQGINEGENGVYISFEEAPDRLAHDLAEFGWDIEKMVKDKKLVILYYTPQQVERVLEAGGGIVRDTLESIKAKRIVIDSLTAFTLLHENELGRRRAVLVLFDNLRKWGVTSIVTSQHEEDPTTPQSSMLDFETDSVILLYSLRKERKRVHGAEIIKVRGSGHSTRIHPWKITPKGVVVEAKPLA